MHNQYMMMMIHHHRRHHHHHHHHRQQQQHQQHFLSVMKLEHNMHKTDYVLQSDYNV